MPPRVSTLCPTQRGSLFALSLCARSLRRVRRYTGMSALLSIKDLKVHFDLGGGGPLDKLFDPNSVKRVVKAVDGVSLDIQERETLGLVGESVCGKSTLGRAILRLTEPTGGHVYYRDRDLAQLSQRQLREQRRH